MNPIDLRIPGDDGGVMIVCVTEDGDVTFDTLGRSIRFCTMNGGGDPRLTTRLRQFIYELKDEYLVRRPSE